MELKLFCIVDQKRIPHERAVRGSNTCCEVCKKSRDKMKRAQVDKRVCRHCRKPSTPEERRLFIKWRKSQPDYKPAKLGRPKGPSVQAIRNLCDLLLVVGHDIPFDVVMGWTANERAQVERWASKSHIAASDNNVRVPKRPAILPATS